MGNYLLSAFSVAITLSIIYFQKECLVICWYGIPIVLLRFVSFHILIYFITILDKPRWNFLYLSHLIFTLILVGFYLFALLSTDYETIDDFQYGRTFLIVYFAFSGLLLVTQMIILTKKSPKSSKNIFIYSIIISFSIGGAIFSAFHIVEYSIFLFFLTKILLGVLYIKNPNLVVFSITKVEQLLFIDGNSGMAIIRIGGESLYPEIMYGSLYVQKQISGTSEIPIELHLGDHKYATIEKIKIGSSSVIGVIFTRNPAFLFRKSLRLSLNEFKSKYGSNYDEISNQIENFNGFYLELQKIFNKTLPPLK